MTVSGGDAVTGARSRHWRHRRSGGERGARIARRIASLVFVLLVLAAWQVSSAYQPPVVMPSPARVANRFVTLWTDPVFLSFALVSVWHVVASIAIAFALGVAISALTFFFPLFDTAVYSRLAPFLNSFSTIGWAFLSLIWFGLTESAVIFATVVSLLPVVVINTGAGLNELNADVLEMSASFTRSRWRRFWLVIRPMLFPYLFATLRLCFGIAWQAVLVVELLCGSSGIGYLISNARQGYATDIVFALALLVVIVVYAADRGFAFIQTRLRTSYGV
jgi:ABC-type nitrate/sulfonate/bicarbonate transport system permease component